MEIFNYLINIYLDKYKYSESEKEMINVAISINTTKFEFLSYIEINEFTTNLIKKRTFQAFNNVQIMYFGFSKLVRIFKFKKCRRYNVTDLHLNPIMKESKNVIQIKQNDFIYLFTRCDLINLLNASLSYSENFFAQSFKCKNPYNTIQFSNTCLYNIYYFLQDGNMAISDLIREYYICDFDLKTFMLYNEEIIRKHAINSFMNSSNPENLRQYIIEMFQDFNPDIYIHKDFSTKKLLNGIVLSYLREYLMIKYSLEKNNIKKIHKKMLFIRLQKFKFENPTFGRVFLKSNVIANNIV